MRQKSIAFLTRISIIGANIFVVNFAEANEVKRWANPSNLKQGIYRLEGSLYRGSKRQVVRQGSRFCVEIAEGIPNYLNV